MNAKAEGPAAKSRTRGSVLIITQYFRPEPNFITADVAQMLAGSRKVTVITAHPNYPHGRFYSGVRWWLPSKTSEGGVIVWRLPMVPDHSNSMVRRLVSYFSFLAIAVLFAPLVAGRPQVVWVYQTPFTSALVALWFKWVYGSRLVYTCADLWPESFTATGVAKQGLLVRLLLAYRRWINGLADEVICSTRGMLTRFASEGVSPHRMHFVPVWVDGSGQSLPPVAVGGEGIPRIVYAGNLGPAQALDTVVHAAAELEKRGVRVAFDFYGSGSSERELKVLTQSLGASNVHFHGRVAPTDVFEISARAFAQVVSLRSTPLFRMTIPSKLPFSFAAASPVLYGLEGESAEIAQASGGAIAFKSSDPLSLVAAVSALLALTPVEHAQMRHRLRAYYEEHFSREKLLRRYREVLLGPSQHVDANRIPPGRRREFVSTSALQ